MARNRGRVRSQMTFGLFIPNRKEARVKRVQYRQGDVLLVPIDEVPADLTPVPRENGRVILAHGEATGHAHAIVDDRAELLGTPNAEGGLISIDEAAELYLLVHGDEPVDLVHDEHDTIAVEPGAYKRIRQREYAPEENRFVHD